MVKKILFGMLAALGLFYVLSSVYLTTADCYNIQKGVATSPDGKYVATYNQEICKSRPSKIEVWLAARKSSTSSLVFTATVTTTEAIQLVWQNEANLQISYPPAMHPENTNSRVNDIAITFSRLE